MNIEERIREVVPKVARQPAFAIYLTAATSRADKACWEYTDGTLPVWMGQLSILMNSPTYSALLAMNARDLYFDIRGMTEKAKERAGEMTPQEMAAKLDELQFLTGWLESIEVVAQEAAGFNDDDTD